MSAESIDEFLSILPSHEVVEKKDGVWIDDFKINNVLTDSVKTNELSPNQTIVHLSFVAKSFEKN